MEIFANDGGLPSTSSIKDISAKSTTLKINIASLPIEVALKDFIGYDKVAIVTRHSIRGDDTSASGPLTELGKTAAENLGKKLKDIFGQRNVKFFATDTVRTKDTCNFINKGWNGNQSPVIDVSKNIINGNYFNVSGSWHDITTISKTTAIKNKVAEWKNLFYDEMPDGISWWVSHDSFLVPIVYNTDNFNPAGLKDLLELSSDPWISPLTGIIIGIKNDSAKVRIVTGLETGFISDTGDWSHDYTDDVLNTRSAEKSKIVATTYTHPKAIGYNATADLDYIFDKGGTNNHPLYCVSDYEGCGKCVSCQTCDGGCQTACQNCDICDSCQTCVSCQTVCQTSGYSKQDAKVRVQNSCSDSCQGCNTCVGGYRLVYKVSCYPCNGCYNDVAKTWSGCSGCQWGCTACTGCHNVKYGKVWDHCSYSSCQAYVSGCGSCYSCNSCDGTCRGSCYSCQSGCYKGCVTCNSQTTVTSWDCRGCNSETAEMCVPSCETGCYKGCTADNATYYNRWHCNDTCMTCVGISQYACSTCYGVNNYDRMI